MAVEPHPDDLELLHLQARAALDAGGGIRGCYGITIATAGDRQSLWLGDLIPAPLAGELIAAFAAAARPAGAAPHEPPPALTACTPILAAAAAVPLQLSAGPSYLIPDDLAFPSDAEVIRSDEPRTDRLRGANPGNWHPVEWDELLDGRLGPWTIATDGARAVSICHTPGPLTERSGECGVWTDPAYRGRGLAAATAAHWVPLVRSPERRLFYSTDFTNRSSQRVAERLGLRTLGATWRLHAPRPPRDPAVHPLCSLYAAP